MDGPQFIIANIKKNASCVSCASCAKNFFIRKLTTALFESVVATQLEKKIKHESIMSASQPRLLMFISLA